MVCKDCYHYMPDDLWNNCSLLFRVARENHKVDDDSFIERMDYSFPQGNHIASIKMHEDFGCIHWKDKCKYTAT